MSFKIYEIIPYIDFNTIIFINNFLPKLFMTIRGEIPLCKAGITSLERKLINEVLETGWLSNGPMLKRFEEAISSFVGTKYAIGVNSGTSALHLSLKSLGIKEGDEVIAPAFSFIASTNPLLIEGIIPVFVDVNPETYLMDAHLISREITERTRAILPVDLLGHAVDIDSIRDVADRHQLSIVEDSCEALGSEYKGKKVGNKSDLACFGFFPNKQITTGEGGVIVTSNEDLAEKCRMMRAHGRASNELFQKYAFFGYNYKMPELSAALGVAQMMRIQEILAQKEGVARIYSEQLSGIEEITLPRDSKHSRKSWFTMLVYFKGIPGVKIMDFLKTKGIQSRDYFCPIHLQPEYVRRFGHKKGDFPVAEDLAKHHLGLPFYQDMNEEEIGYVTSSLKEAIHKNK